MIQKGLRSDDLKNGMEDKEGIDRWQNKGLPVGGGQPEGWEVKVNEECPGVTRSKGVSDSEAGEKITWRLRKEGQLFIETWLADISLPLLGFNIFLFNLIDNYTDAAQSW